jgi:hypothetical protein
MNLQIKLFAIFQVFKDLLSSYFNEECRLLGCVAV